MSAKPPLSLKKDVPATAPGSVSTPALDPTGEGGKAEAASTTVTENVLGVVDPTQPSAEILTTVQPPVVSELERLALAAQREGDHVRHALLNDLHVAAGMLKHKLAAARAKVSEAEAALLAWLHGVL